MSPIDGKTQVRSRYRLNCVLVGGALAKRSSLSWRIIVLIVVSALISRKIAVAGEVDSALVSSQALWVSNGGSASNFITELPQSQLQHSGLPKFALNTGRSNVGYIGKLAFDQAGNLWIPFCGNETTTYGLVAAFSPAALDQFAAGNRRVKPKAELIGSGFNCPIALAFDHSGNLWIENAGFSDHNSKSIIEYTASSLLQKNSAPSVTLTSSSFEFLRRLAFDAAGDLWVTNEANDETDGVYEFTPQQLSTGGSQPAGLILQSSIFHNPEDIIFDAANNIWIDYGGNNQPQPGPGGVQMFAAANLTGSGAIKPPPGVTIGGQPPCSVLAVCFPSALAFDQNGNLWIAQSDTISEFTTAQLASGNPSLAQVILASDLRSAHGGRLNFGGPGYITFGPETK